MLPIKNTLSFLAQHQLKEYTLACDPLMLGFSLSVSSLNRTSKLHNKLCDPPNHGATLEFGVGENSHRGSERPGESNDMFQIFTYVKVFLP